MKEPKEIKEAKELKKKGYARGTIIARGKTIDKIDFLLLKTIKHKKLIPILENRHIFIHRGLKRGDTIYLNTSIELEYVWEKLIEKKNTGVSRTAGRFSKEKKK